MDYIIDVEDLRKVYSGNIEALKGINLKIRKGEIYGFLGPNGAGKTTTVKILTTIIKPTSGTAYISGYHIIKNQKEVRKIIGLVPQDLTVDDDLTGMENLVLQASFYNIKREEARKKAIDLLELVDLKDAADRLVSTYSGGMRKRLDLIVGLIHDPDILFLDEPTLGLDVQTRTRMWEYIELLRKEFDKTIFITTHYLEEAEKLCDRIGIIDHGKIVVEGSPDELKSSVDFDLVELDVDNLQEAMKILVNFDAETRENKIIIKIRDSEKNVLPILKTLTDKSINIKRIHIEKPSLNSVFLKYTGREMREGESEEDIMKTMRAIRRAR
ncbi:MAG: ATP-binding cassette domain-containing protein [Thermoplasmata archaeon]